MPYNIENPRYVEKRFNLRKNKNGTISGLVELARAHFSYDASTGILTHKDPGFSAYATMKGWKIASRFFGMPAGSVNSAGYIRVQIRGNSFVASRLIWAMVYGYDPEHDIDHIDQDRTNNRLSNLREATRSQNCMNRGERSDNKSGVRGVYWHKASSSWVASICRKGKSTHLGCFKSIADAESAYKKAAASIHGEFSFYNSQG